jgi:hypothetical protein
VIANEIQLIPHQPQHKFLWAPDIQEAILFLPRVKCGGDPIHLRQLQGIAIAPDWGRQRRMWKDLSWMVL